MVWTHGGHHTTGADAIVEAGPALVVGVVALVQHVLVAVVVGLLVGHPAAALHLDGVAAADVAVHLGAVDAALIVAALEVLVLVKDDLEDKREMDVEVRISVSHPLSWTDCSVQLCTSAPSCSVVTQGLHKPDHICFPLLVNIKAFSI